VGTWANLNSLAITEESRHSGSDYSGYCNFNAGSQLAAITAVSSVVSRKWFVQYWFKLEEWDWGAGTYSTNDRFLANVKFFRLWSPASVAESFVCAWKTWATGSAFSKNSEVVGTGANVEVVFSLQPFQKPSVNDGEWHCFQFEFTDSSDVSAADAEFRVWIDGEPAEVRTGFIARSTTYLKRPLEIGFYNSWGPNTALGESAQAPNHYYMGDIYAAPTLARVEMGNAATYDACTHREVQIPTAWADTEITVTVNRGSFAADDEVYLFVVDDDGAKSAGYGPITLE
jgi:hypothetical protein